MEKYGKALNERKEIAKRMLIDEVVADIVNGVSKRDVLTKLREGIYTYATQPTMSVTQSYRYWNDAMEAMKINYEAGIEEKRKVLWNRYENLYQNSLELGNYKNARACLADMAKLFGIASPEKQEITVNDAVISFGFGKNV